MSGFLRRLSLLLLLACSLRAEVPPLLQEVAATLVDERQHWAFTQRVREFDGDKVVVDRVERFDPARGQEKRWLLVKLNGRTPTPEEVEKWSQKKNRARKRPSKDVNEYVDLEQARVREETASTISYEVPFRRSAGGLFPGEKVALTLTINKQTHALERAQVSIDESFKVALGLAQVVDIDLDLEMPNKDGARKPGDADHGAAEGKSGEAGKPQGTASAVVNKFGRRFEYYWTDFTRHDSLPAAAK
ncbi:MAG TPA: hypothetical protein VG734_24045 [Lacunisphaera sp.]|nr:hypothetical protein [Lacunisphaera sp.]